MLNFVRYPDRECYDQIHQDCDLEWCPVNVVADAAIARTDWFECRDFWNDMVYMSIFDRFNEEENESDFHVYGMTTVPGMLLSTIGDKKKFTIAARVPNEYEEEMLNLKKGIREIINPMCKEHGIEPIQIRNLDVGDYSKGCVLICDEFWTKRPYLISYFTLVLRVLSYNGNLSEGYDNDYAMFSTVRNYVSCLCDDSDTFKFFATLKPKVDTLCVHPWGDEFLCNYYLGWDEDRDDNALISCDPGEPLYMLESEAFGHRQVKEYTSVSLYRLHDAGIKSILSTANQIKRGDSLSGLFATGYACDLIAHGEA